MSQATVQPLAWDSQFLGFPVGRLVAQPLNADYLAAALQQSQAAGFRLLYLVANPTDEATAAAARRAGAWLADRKVTFALEIEAKPPNSLSSVAESAYIARVASFTPQLERLAWQSGEFSRFRRDAQFAPHVFPNLYSHWLRASLTEEIAQLVLASLASTGEETGLLTLARQGAQASIGLLAVETQARGQGIGRQLVAAAYQQARDWGCAHLQVVTQYDNQAACRFYAQCGFKLVREEHLYHLWL